MPIVFGTYNTTTASPAEVELSQSFQTALADFAKNPVDVSPAPNWPQYEPGFLGIARNPTLAKLAYDGNVDLDDFIKLVQPISIVSTLNDYANIRYLSLNVLFVKQDVPCIVWDRFLDYRPSTDTGSNSHETCMVDDQVGVQDSAFGSYFRVQAE